jgi:hypothetical protein
MLAMAQLSEESFSALKDALLSAKKTSDKAELAAEIAATATTIEPKVVLSILRCLFNMESVRADKSTGIPEFVKDVVGGTIAADSPTFSESEGRTAAERILQLLVVDGPATYAAKIQDIMTDHQRVFCSCRVLTDIRPVFLEDAAIHPKEAVIIHTVKIAYHEDGAHKEFYVALDSSDVDKLRIALERAASKGKTTKALLAAANISDVSTG